MDKTHAHTHARTQLPELAAERGDLPRHALTAVSELLQLPLQLPPLGVGARVLLLHLLQLPLQLLQAHHGFIQLEKEAQDGAYCRGEGDREEKRTDV